MPGVARLADIDIGHGFPPRPNILGAPTVLVNGRPAHRVGDLWNVHPIPLVPGHMVPTVVGSTTVIVAGQPVARIGDIIGDGSVIALGSTDVIAGG